MAEKSILIICGEASGDLHAASLAQEILKIDPAIKISGVGGELLRKSGAELYADIKDLAVIGLFDVLKKLPKFFALKKTILDKIRERKPDLIILIDFSGFNLRLAKEIDGKIPIIYYVSPQVWASRAGRLKTIKKYIRKMIVLFKFEEEFYQKYGIPVDFVGHPLLDIVRSTDEKNNLLQQFGISKGKTTVALLPGSRKQEIANILPVMLNTAALIYQLKPQAQFIIAKSQQVDWEYYRSITDKFKLDLKIIEGRTYDCLEAADFAFVASGTATLETAILKKPFVIIYKMGLLNYLLYRPQVKIPYIGMVNIVAQKKIIPEFIQFQANPKKIAEYVLPLLSDQTQLQTIKDDLAQVKDSLGQKGAAARAARIIVNFLNTL